MTMQPIPLEPGMRVRCVDAIGSSILEHGAEYVVEGKTKLGGTKLLGFRGGWYAERFKPIIRVKAPCIPSIDVMIKRAKAWFDALTPAEQKAHMTAQRDSYVRGEMELSRLERDAERTRHIFAVVTG